MEADINNSFSDLFRALTDNEPFPWQKALYEKFVQGEIPSAADLPTGLGKTSVVAIWLAALISNPAKMPRRLIYVVNRRTVVDQTTAEVVRLRERLHESPELLAKLSEMPSIPSDSPLAISTLRGQFADNREWCADPARPAVIVGTVDMIGSGLLFSRYTCGFKTRPHHAALLGQDALLVHDEAHLEPAFQRLLNSIIAAQKSSKDPNPLRLLELSATTREADSPFSLTSEDENDERIKMRLCASKRLVLHSVADEKQLPDELAKLALEKRDSGRAVLVFARSVDVVQRVAEALEKQKLQKAVLTGTMRGLERDNLAQTNRVFLRFLPPSSRPEDSPAPAEGTVFLIATSAGEVGVNISADDLICDLSTYESIAQRFGRVNRFGSTTDSTIELVYPESLTSDDPFDDCRARTLGLLRRLNGHASPDALRRLDPADRAAAFSPLPEMRPATDILFDAWAMTSIREFLPGRPPVAPYLHGEQSELELETYVAWRDEVDFIRRPILDYYTPETLLEDYPLRPRELLRDRSYRVREQLAHIWERIAEMNLEAQVWIISDNGNVEAISLSIFADKESESRLRGRMILLPPSAGGLSREGLLDGRAEPRGDIRYDAADMEDVRKRIFCSTPEVPNELSAKFRLSRVIDRWRASEDDDENQVPAEERYWLWLEAPVPGDKGGIYKAGKAISLEDHTRDVERLASAIVQKLKLPKPLSSCVVLAGRFHDSGKNRRYWQRGIGNDDPNLCFAKAGRELRPRGLDEPYRHEFGSLRDVALEKEIQKLSPDERDLVFHLIAAHHGRARPHFPTEEVFDPDAPYADSEMIATQVPCRFARLQRRFGRWGLAYLESLLRAADYAASAGTSS